MHDAILPPLITPVWAKWLVIGLAYGLTVGLSSLVVRKTLQLSDADQEVDSPEARERRRLGGLIGKCENLIIVTFILLDATTALALVFTAKALVRRQDIQEDPGYFLGGTLINFVWSLLVAGLARLLIAGL